MCLDEIPNQAQRKTKLKWKKNCDLSEIIMLRVLNNLSAEDLHYYYLIYAL